MDKQADNQQKKRAKGKTTIEESITCNVWTLERRERQSRLIHNWKPWEKTKGPATPEGKKKSSKNAIAYSIREVGREIARQNRVLIAYMNGSGKPLVYDMSVMNGLLDKLEKAFTHSKEM